MRRVSAGLPQTIDRAYAPMAFVATGVLEVERREVQLVGALHRCERDGEVLDREAGRVEDGDVARRLAAGRLSHENCAELVRLVLSDRTGLDGVSELAVVACLFPVVTEDASTRHLADRNLGLTRAAGAHQADVLSRLQRAFRKQNLVAGRHRGYQIGGECLLARASHAGAELVRRGSRALLIDVPEHHSATAGQERLRRGPAV